MRRSTQACVELLAAVPIGKRAAPQHEQIGKGDGDVPLGIDLRHGLSRVIGVVLFPATRSRQQDSPAKLRSEPQVCD